MKEWVNVNKKELFIFIVLFIFLIIRSKIGFPSTDEQFYVATPFRFISGDNFFVDEWHIAQLSSFLTLPISKLSSIFNSGSTGSIYFFRFSYVMMNLMVSILIFKVSNRNIISLLAACLFLIWCPFNIMSLSYNTMGVALNMLNLVVIWKVENRFKYIFSGILYALATLCAPYMAIVFFLFFLIYLGRIIMKKESNIVNFCLFLIGIGSVFLVFIAVTILPIGIDAFFESIISNFLNDPTHQTNFMVNLIDLFWQFIRFTNIFLVIWIALLALIIYKHTNNKTVNMLVNLSIVNCVIFAIVSFVLYNITPFQSYFMNINLMISLLGFTAYFASKKANKKLFTLYCISFLYPMLLYLQSNVPIMPLTTGLIVVNVLSLLLLSEIDAASKNVKVAFFIIYIIANLGMKTYIFDYRGVSYIPNQMIEDGALKGIYVSNDEKLTYERWLLEKDKFSDLDGKILFVDDQPYRYLDVDLRCGNFSTYDYIIVEDLRNLYYEKHLNKSIEKVDYIYFENNNNLNLEVLDSFLEQYFTLTWTSFDGTMYEKK